MFVRRLASGLRRAGAWRQAAASSRAISAAPASRAFHATPTPLGGGVSGVHIDTPDNTEDTPFDFTELNYKKVYVICGATFAFSVSQHHTDSQVHCAIGPSSPARRS